jgi:hypothetical protein
MKAIKYIITILSLGANTQSAQNPNVWQFEYLPQQKSLTTLTAYMPIEDVKEANDTILLAALLSTECKRCNEKEKMLLAQTVVDRANDKSFIKRFGSTVFDQIFAYAQFSGAKDGLRGSVTGKYFRYDPKHPRYGKKSVELYNIARRVLKGERIVKRVRYFANVEISTDTTFIKWLLEDPLILDFPTKHTFRE